MHLKQISKRRWKARWLKGLWIPSVIVHGYGFAIPTNHETLNSMGTRFLRIRRIGTKT